MYNNCQPPFVCQLFSCILKRWVINRIVEAYSTPYRIGSIFLPINVSRHCRTEPRPALKIRHTACGWTLKCHKLLREADSKYPKPFEEGLKFSEDENRDWMDPEVCNRLCSPISTMRMVGLPYQSVFGAMDAGIISGQRLVALRGVHWVENNQLWS